VGADFPVPGGPGTLCNLSMMRALLEMLGWILGRMWMMKVGKMKENAIRGSTLDILNFD
jgi:hypothetical protein